MSTDILIRITIPDVLLRLLERLTIAGSAMSAPMATTPEPAPIAPREWDTPLRVASLRAWAEVADGGQWRTIHGRMAALPGSVLPTVAEIKRWAKRQGIVKRPTAMRLAVGRALQERRRERLAARAEGATPGPAIDTPIPVVEQDEDDLGLSDPNHSVDANKLVSGATPAAARAPVPITLEHTPVAVWDTPARIAVLLAWCDKADGTSWKTVWRDLRALPGVAIPEPQALKDWARRRGVTKRLAPWQAAKIDKMNAINRSAAIAATPDPTPNQVPPSETFAPSSGASDNGLAVVVEVQSTAAATSIAEASTGGGNNRRTHRHRQRPSPGRAQSRITATGDAGRRPAGRARHRQR